MIKRDEAFLARLLAMFNIEAQEHIQKITDGLLLLEKADQDSRHRYIEEIYREFHSLKGAARAVDLTEVESLCQSLEGVFSKLKKNQMEFSPSLFDLIHNAMNAVTEFLNGTPESREKTLSGKISSIEKTLIEFSVSNPEAAVNSNPETYPASIPYQAPLRMEEMVPSKPATEVFENSCPVFEKQSSVDTIRISSAKLDSLLLQGEELLNVKLTTSQHVNELSEVYHKLEIWHKEWEKIQTDFRTIRLKLNSEKISFAEKERTALTKLMNFYEWNNSQISAIDQKVTLLLKTFKNDNRLLGGMVDNLLEDMKEVMMHPVSSVLSLLQKITRDLSADLGKSVELEIDGGEIQLDRRILDEMKDPFIHLLRNCIDHGIEKPDERLRKGKNPKGKIKITVERLSGSEVSIAFEDDGNGIDLEKVKKTALAKKLLTVDEVNLLSDEAAMRLILKSDFSTSEVITDLSGRGLGLAILQEKIEKLNGSLYIKTTSGKGTTFTIQLPVTLATFRGIQFTLSGRSFIVPTTEVERIRRVLLAEIKTVENKATILRADRPISLVKMHDILQIKETERSTREFIIVIILRNQEKQIAFVVDEIVGEQEVLVKPFNLQLTRVKNIAGATILGSGKVIPILNVADLLKSAEKTSSSLMTPTEEISGAELITKSILVTDDSITSRMLIKDILESSGYKVTTAIDGLEALTVLKTQNFDAVVSDVEMPRMSGFELAKNIRADEKLSHLPVVLVTALASKEDREKGIDSGANAYIIKSNFDQSNLLETIKRLI